MQYTQCSLKSRHHIRRRKAFTVQNRVSPFPTIKVSNRAFEIILREPEFRNLGIIVHRDAGASGEDYTLHDAITMPVLFPAVVGLFEDGHRWEGSGDVVGFVFVCWVEEWRGVFDYFDEVHKGGFRGNGVLSEEITAVFIAGLGESFVEEARAERDEMIAVVTVAKVACWYWFS